MNKVMLSAGMGCVLGVINGLCSHLDPVATKTPIPSRVWYYGGEAFENEQFLFIRLWREVTNELQTVEYATSGGSAIPGVDYLATNGVASFPPGVSEVRVPVQLLDNPRVDGDRTVGLVLSNPSPGLDPDNFGDVCMHGPPWIRDNELAPAREDPTFIPEVAAATQNMSKGPHLMASMAPEDRLFIHKHVMMLADGSIDPAFQLEAGAYGDHVGNSSEGHLIIEKYGNARSLLFVNMAGKIAKSLSLEENAKFVAAQPDGKILVDVKQPDGTHLNRLKADGTLDAGFTPVHFDGSDLKTHVLRDGKIVVNGIFFSVNGELRSKAVRLNADGSVDVGFNPALPDMFVNSVAVRGNGKMLVWAEVWGEGIGPRLFQLNTDGTRDDTFKLPLVPGALDRTRFIGETTEGKVFFIQGDSLVRMMPDGSPDPSFVPHVLNDSCAYSKKGVVMLPSGKLLVYGHSIPYVRLNTMDAPPEREFRVLPPPGTPRCKGKAAVRIARTGSTEAEASIHYQTRDLSARAGRDYLPQSGTVLFPPLTS